MTPAGLKEMMTIYTAGNGKRLWKEIMTTAENGKEIMTTAENGKEIMEGDHDYGREWEGYHVSCKWTVIYEKML